MSTLFSGIIAVLTKSGSAGKVTGLVLLLLLAGMAWSLFWGSGHKEEAERLGSILQEKEVEYEDKLGRHVAEVTQLETKNRDLRQVVKKDSAELSDYEKKIYSISKELEANKRQLRHVQSALLFTAATKDSFALQLETKDSLLQHEIEQSGDWNTPWKYGEFEDKWSVHEFAYNPNNDSLYVEQTKEVEFFVDVFRRRELNKKGEPRFFLWRWLYPWEYKASIKSLNDSTVIKESVFINVR